jgi:hypothetical protein
MTTLDNNLNSSSHAADSAALSMQDSLSSGIFNPVTRNDVQNVFKAIAELPADQASKAFAQLSDAQLDTLAGEMQPEGFNRFDGYSPEQRAELFANLSSQLDGQQLSRFSAALSREGGAGDIEALGSAVAANATPQAKADFIANLAQTGGIQEGKTEIEGGVFSSTSRSSTPQTQAAIEVLGSLQGQDAAFNQAIGSLSDQQLKTVLNASRGETVKDNTWPVSNQTTFNAQGLGNIQQVAETTGDKATQARVLNGVNEQISTFRAADTVNTADGNRLEKSFIPAIPNSAEQVTAKQEQIAAQQQRIADLRAVGTPEALALADQLQKDYHARELGNLASDVYHWESAAAHAQAPVGWTRASESPEVLARYGLTQADLRPDASGFRAEIYVPDPAILGPDAKPVLSFKGTTASSPEDWANNFTQGTGGQTDYYDRAMRIATQVNNATGGEVEFTGHSLGGGLASAASAVTGVNTVTFNSAGLHANTAARFLSNSNAVPFDTNRTVQPYQVNGEILTTLQESAKDIDPMRAEQLGGVVRFAAGVGSNPWVRGKIEEARNGSIGDFSGLAQAQGGDLLRMAEAAGSGNAIKLDAYEVATDANGNVLRDPVSGQPVLRPSANAAAEFSGPNGLATRADTILDRYDANVARGDAQSTSVPNILGYEQAAYRAGVRAGAAKQAYDDYRSDSVLSNAGPLLGESVKRHGTYNESLDHRISGLEAQAEQLLR